MKDNTFLSTIDLDITEEEVKEAFASLNYNKQFCTPVKFIFTDSFANANKQRIPNEEFDNVVRTGFSMPIKAYLLDGITNADHKKATPIGAITNLVKSGNTVAGLGVLWREERPEEVAYIKACYDSKIPVNLSWEIGYTDSRMSEDGVEDLLGVIVRATTIVGDPAYQGRTPILSMAQRITTENNMNELEQKVAELEALLVSTKEEYEAKMKEMVDEMSSLKTINEELATYKQGIEATEARIKKEKEIKDKFVTSGIQKDDEYFASRMDKFIAFDEDELNFFLQELVSFGTASVHTESEHVEVPNFVDTKKKVDATELGRKLRESNISLK
jgi:hypothetical protein